MKTHLKLILILLITLLPYVSHATHMMGGEVSYTCLGGNRFRVQMVLYQDCLSASVAAIDFDNPAYYAIFKYMSSSADTFLLQTHGEVYVKSQSEVPPDFFNECISNFPDVCMMGTVFEFEVTLPPNEYGYEIVYQRCCRNHTISNVVSPGTEGVTYNAFIPGFANNECPNNSPVFTNLPPQIICNNFNFTYDYSVTDIDGDSVVYRLCYSNAAPMDAKPTGDDMEKPPYTSVDYVFGYSFDQPFPSTPAISVDPHTGVFTAHPTLAGRYQVRLCVDEYRDGKLLNTHSRDLQFMITDCSKNVEANTPLFSDEPNVYIINCENYTVNFQNSSTGGFSYIWDFGDGTPEVEAETPSHTYSDTGTYRVKLVVNRGTTCADSIVRIVKIYPVFTADFTFEGKMCPGEEVKLIPSITASGDYPYSILWDLGNGDTTSEMSPTVIYNSPGIYSVSLTARNSLGCNTTVTRDFEVIDFKPYVGNDTIVVLGYFYRLNATGGDTYQWTPSDYLSDANIANPIVDFPDTGYYTFYVDISVGAVCEKRDTINVLVVKEPQILMPNVFSPNGDGLNDVFRPNVIGYPIINSFRIYNRWGEEVFVSYNNKGWDGTYSGKACDAGVYFYRLEVTNVHGERKDVKGDITLVR